MANVHKPEVSAEDINKAKNLWHGFTKMITWSTVSIIACLALMALFLL